MTPKVQGRVIIRLGVSSLQMLILPAELLSGWPHRRGRGNRAER